MENHLTKFRDVLQAAVDGPPDMEKARDLLRDAAIAIESKFRVAARVVASPMAVTLEVATSDGPEMLCTLIADMRGFAVHRREALRESPPYGRDEGNWAWTVTRVEQSLRDALPMLRDLDFAANARRAQDRAPLDETRPF